MSTGIVQCDDGVSVVIPAYNSAHFIARAVRSALEQSHQAQEVIVVDDGSTDDTRRVLAQFGERIKVISTSNGGVARARNVGMRASGGKLIAFLDADDIWQPDKLAVQVTAMRAYPQAGLCCCNYLLYDPYRACQVLHFSQFENEPLLNYDAPMSASPFDVLIKFNFVGTASNVLMRRSVMDAVGLFDERYRQAEDYDYWLRCARVTGFIALSARLMEKTTHANNLTNNWLETCLCHELVLQSLQLQGARPVLPGPAHLGDAVERALARLRYTIANQYFEDGAIGRAASYYVLGLRTRPTPTNTAQFCLFVGRKLIRLMSFGLLRTPRANAVHNKGRADGNH